MVTLRQIERWWETGQFDRIARLLTEGRYEASIRLRLELAKPAATAAVIAIRLDELAQSYTPLMTRMIRVILSAQEADGGWGDAVCTALCIRALLCGQGTGQAIDRGLNYLRSLQREDGAWPHVPMRRMPGDAWVTAMVLYQLGHDPQFVQSVRCQKALDWLHEQIDWLDADAGKLMRVLTARSGRMQAATS